MACLQAALGVDSVARFLAAHAHPTDALAHARRLAHTETLARLGGLPALCADAAASEAATGAGTSVPRSRTRHPHTEEEEHGRDDFAVAQELTALLARRPEDAADLARNAAARGVASAALCQALCVWAAAHPPAPGALAAALDAAFRLSTGARRLRTREQRAIVTFLRALAQEPGYADTPREFAAQLAAQAAADAAAARPQPARALAHTLAAVAQDLALGTAPVYALAAALLSRVDGGGAVGVVCAAVAGWPEAFVARRGDLFAHALCHVVCASTENAATATGDERTLVSRARAACHWRPATAEALAHALADPRALTAGTERRHEWACAVCVLAARVPEFAQTLARAAATHGTSHATRLRRVLSAAGFPG